MMVIKTRDRGDRSDHMIPVQRSCNRKMSEAKVALIDPEP